MFSWIRALFSGGEPLVKIAGGLGEHEAKMLVELLRNDGIGAVIKNMSFLSVTYGASFGYEYDLWVRAGDQERACEIAAAVLADEQLIECEPEVEIPLDDRDL